MRLLILDFCSEGPEHGFVVASVSEFDAGFVACSTASRFETQFVEGSTVSSSVPWFCGSSSSPLSHSRGSKNVTTRDGCKMCMM